jgi:hypothetical protein
MAAASNFSSLRNNRKTALAKIQEEIKKESQKGGGADARFWKLTVDQKTKVGYAVIRFLPAPKNEESYWARLFSHSFKMNGSWLIENCPTSLDGRACPVCKENNKLWNSGVDADKDVARERKRKLQFISNILVLEDKAHPENVGKVFLFKYGAKIHEKIQELIDPQFPDAEPTNPFDFWEGCNFKLKAQQKDGFQNYDKSQFDAPSAIAEGDDDAIELVWNQEHSLIQFTAENQFKNFEELEKRLQRVLTGNAVSTAADAVKAQQPTPAVAQAVAEAVAAEDDQPAPPVRARRTPPAKVTAPVEADAVPTSEDDIKKFFGEVLK